MSIVKYCSMTEMSLKAVKLIMYLTFYRKKKKKTRKGNVEIGCC